MNDTENVINSSLDFLDKIKKEKEVKIKFIKKDNSIRIMKCTLDFNQIPKSSYPKGVDLHRILNLIKNNKILKVFDLEKKEWRSVPFDKVEWLETSTAVFRVSNSI